MNLNKDALLDELTDFASQKPAEIPTSLDEYLGNVAKTGDTLFPWQNLKPLLCRKLELVMNEFYKQYPTDDLPALPNVEPFKYEDMKAKILESINCFTSAPFTIQRLCELVVDPRKHYRRTDKFMRGLEKNVLVVSTVEPKSAVDPKNSRSVTRGT
ncbi:putative serine/threonine protein phosphatase 4 regulatory subunit [Ixodes scapularis]